MFGIDDAIEGGMAIAGLATSLSGASKASAAAKQQAQLSGDIANQEMQQDQLRAQAMEVSARRQSMEILRNQQRARAMALNTATNQGAAFGDSSGIQGAYGGISGQSSVNAAGVNTSLLLGRNMFSLNSKIDQDKMQLAQVGGDLASAQGMMSLGGSLMGSAGTMGKLGKNFLGSGSPFGNLMSSVGGMFGGG